MSGCNFTETCPECWGTMDVYSDCTIQEINNTEQESSARSSEIAEQPEKDVKQEGKKIQRIRVRSSYSLFRELYNFLEDKPSITDILWKFYSILDARHSFGSRTSASYAAESLGLVLRDKAEPALKRKGGEACQRH
jgi:hypothetical protein